MRDQVGVAAEVLVDLNWTLTQDLGMAAHALGIQAILSRSATGVDTVIAVFSQNLGLSSFTAELVEQWIDSHVIDEAGGPA